MSRYFSLLLLFCSIGYNAKADTIDYFIVRHNDRNIPIEIGGNNVYKLSLANIAQADSFSIYFGSDTPCFECVSIAYTVSSRSAGIKPDAIAYAFGINAHKATFSLQRLKRSVRLSKDREFDIYYYEQGLTTRQDPQRVLRIILE